MSGIFYSYDDDFPFDVPDDDYNVDEPDYDGMYDEPDYFAVLDEAYANEREKFPYTVGVIEIAQGVFVIDHDWIPF